MATAERGSVDAGHGSGKTYEEIDVTGRPILDKRDGECSKDVLRKMNCSKVDEAEKLVSDTSHVALIRQNYCQLVNELQPQLFHHVLEPYLRNSIEEETSKKKQSRELLDLLTRSPKHYFDHFCEIIAGIHPTLFELLKKRKPTRDESDCYLKPFCEKLRQVILKTGSKTDNDIDSRIDLDKQFVSLKLTDISKYQGDSNQRNNHPYYLLTEQNAIPDYYHYSLEEINQQVVDIDDILPKESVAKATLVTGRAGVGKSTLVQFVTRQWAKGEWGTSHTAVFLLNLRNVANIQRAISLSELLGMYAEYVPYPPDSRPPAEQWLENNQERVILFIDGVDELSNLSRLLMSTRTLATSMMATPLEWCINLMRRDILQHTTLFVISRPFSGLQDLTQDTQIDVRGLDPEKIMQFVELNIMPAKQSIVKETLHQNPVLLSVCSITFYCAAITKILEEDENIDVSALTTYTRIIAFIITHLAARRARKETASLVLTDDLVKCLPHMAALAYRGLSVGVEDVTRLIFQGKDFLATRISHEEIRQARETGLLVCMDVKDPLAGSNTGTFQAEFVHLSVQELLAAAHMLKTDAHTIETYLEEATMLGQLNMSQLFLFGLALDQENMHVAAINQGVMREGDCKLTNDHRAEIEHSLLQYFKLMCDRSTTSGADVLQILQTAHESQRSDVAYTAGARVAAGGKLDMFSLHLTAVDMKALFFVLKETTIERLAFHDLRIDNASAWEIKKNLSQYQHLRSLCLDNNDLTEEAMMYVSEAVKATKSLMRLVLKNKDITTQGIKYLADALNANPTVNTLQLMKDTFTVEDMELLCLATRSSLKHLQLFCDRIDPDAMLCLSTAITASTSLNDLQLIAHQLASDGMRHLSYAVQNSTTLNELQLTNHTITPKAMKYLSTAIKNSKCLNILRLTSNQICLAGMQDLSCAVSCCESLTTLILRKLQLKDESIEHLSRAIKTTTSLRELTLVENQITDEGIEQLSDAVKRAKSLNSLGLMSNTITSRGMSSISDAIRDSSTLQHLHLSNNHIPNNGLKALSSGLSSTKTLTRLQYMDNHITTKGMKHLAAALKSTRSVNHVLLATNDITDKGLELLTDAIIATRSLYSLVIFDNDLTDERMYTVTNALKRSSRNIHFQKKGLETRNEHMVCGQIDITGFYKRFITLQLKWQT